MSIALRSLALPLLLAGPSAFADVETPSYKITIGAPATKVGATSHAEVKVQPGKGLHVNKDFPTALKLTAPAGIDLPTPTINKANGAKIDESAAQFDVTFTPKETGKKTFSGTLNFAVCTATTCDPHSEKVSFTVEVK